MDNASNEIMDEVMKEWQQRKRGVSTYDAGGSGAGSEGNVTLPLSQGEWDEPLGMPLCVVCHNVRLANNSIAGGTILMLVLNRPIRSTHLR